MLALAGEKATLRMELNAQNTSLLQRGFRILQQKVVLVFGLFHDEPSIAKDQDSGYDKQFETQFTSLEQIALFTEQLAREFYFDEPDRRSESRCNVTIPIIVEPLDDQRSPLGYSISAVSRDMSSSGMGLVSRDPVHSRYVRLQFELPSKTQVDVIGEVLRCRPLGYYFNVGIRYVADHDQQSNYSGGLTPSGS